VTDSSHSTTVPVPRGRRALVAALLVLAVGGVLAGCSAGPGSGSPGGADTVAGVGRCEPASDSAVTAISDGLRNGLTLTNAYIVKSNDYNAAYFLSGRIQGASGEPIGTWALADPEDVGSLLFSVTEPAKRNSRFSDANGSFSGSDDGVSQSQGCANVQ